MTGIYCPNNLIKKSSSADHHSETANASRRSLRRPIRIQVQSVCVCACVCLDVGLCLAVRE